MLQRTVLVALAFLTVPILGCNSDYSSDLERGADGLIESQDIWLAPGSRQYVYAPDDELFVNAESSAPGIARVDAVDGDRVTLRTGMTAGDATLSVATDHSTRAEGFSNVLVRHPDSVEFHDEHPWYVIGDHDVGYDFYFEETELEGLGYPPFRSHAEVEFEDTSDFGSRHVEMSANPGTYELETVAGEIVEFHSLVPEDIERIEVEAPTEGTAGKETAETASVRVRGYVGEHLVRNFRKVSVRSKTWWKCSISERHPGSGAYTADLNLKRPGTCELVVRSRVLDFEERLLIDISAQ